MTSLKFGVWTTSQQAQLLYRVIAHYSMPYQVDPDLHTYRVDVQDDFQ